MWTTIGNHSHVSCSSLDSLAVPGHHVWNLRMEDFRVCVEILQKPAIAGRNKVFATACLQA